jgi:hypothetical protein
MTISANKNGWTSRPTVALGALLDPLHLQIEAVAEEKAGQEIAQLPTRLAGSVGDEPKQPTLI